LESNELAEIQYLDLIDGEQKKRRVRKSQICFCPGAMSQVGQSSFHITLSIPVDMESLMKVEVLVQDQRL
jgi:hypothetical protein